MMRLLVFAHRGEAQAFFKYLDLKGLQTSGTALFQGKEEWLLICGEGSVNSLHATSWALGRHQEIESVWNLGVAGALRAKIEIGQCYLPHVHYAQNAEALSKQSYQSAKKLSPIECMSYSARVFDEKLRDRLAVHADLVDREAWWIAAACAIQKIPFYSVKLAIDRANADSDCLSLRARADEYSEVLWKKYQESLTELRNIPTKENQDYSSNIFSHSHFHFSQYQRIELTNLLKKLSVKLNCEVKEILPRLNYDALKNDLNFRPKDRGRELIGRAKRLLNPLRTQVENLLEEKLSHLSPFKSHFDNELESSSIRISAELKTQKDIEELKQALTNFNFENYQKVFDGDLS